jgi:hypothetical protein
MFISLTNANEAHKGNKIAINIDLIATVYNNANLGKKEDGIIENITYVYCPPHGIWEVEESVDEIITELNNFKWNNK